MKKTDIVQRKFQTFVIRTEKESQGEEFYFLVLLYDSINGGLTALIMSSNYRIRLYFFQPQNNIRDFSYN